MIIFCADPLDPRQPDPDYLAEAAAAKRFDFATAIINYEALVHENDIPGALQSVPLQSKPTSALYRGWMLRPEKYQLLFDGLLKKSVRLINDPVAYRLCHYLPECYAAIETQTPRSVWIKTTGDVSLDEIARLLRPFGSVPVIVKDFVKSRKHEWAEACFIPSATDLSDVERVVRRFLELQGDDLNEGLVFREFVEFQPLGIHPKSGMPLTREFRLFYLDGTQMFLVPYWDVGDYHGELPPLDQFAAAAKSVRSRFFTMDVAQRRDGEWLIMELGDAQVSGLPENADKEAFYQSLRDHWLVAPSN